jgi:hypothetical protein
MRKLAFISFLMISIISLTSEADENLVGLVKMVRPAVVLLETFDEHGTTLQQGSGFFVTSKGDLITNLHVVQGAHSAAVHLSSGEEYQIEGVTAIDADGDLVRLLAQTKGAETPFINPVNISPQVGEDIVVVGNPLGLESTVSKGIVAGIRELPEGDKILQISAPISHGSSGSPVLNMRGEVIGVATLTITEGQALNFAVPSSYILGLKTEKTMVKLADFLLTSQDQVGIGQAFSVPPTSAVDNPCLKFLPEDWWFVANFNCKAYFSFVEECAADNPALGTMMAQYVEMIKGLVAIDPRREVEYVTCFVSGHPDLSPKALVVVAGSFDNQLVELRLSLLFGAELTRNFYKGKTIYQHVDMGYAFPKESTLLLGTPTLLGPAIDATELTAKSLPKSLVATLKYTNGDSIIWMAAKPKVILEMEDVRPFAARNKELFATLAPIECGSAFIQQTSNGYLACCLAYTNELEAAKVLHNYLAEMKRTFLDVHGANVFLCSFLLMSDILREGQYVRWDMRLTETALIELWETKFLRALPVGNANRTGRLKLVDAPVWVNDALKEKLYSTACIGGKDLNIDEQTAASVQQNIVMFVPWLDGVNVQTTRDSLLISGRWRKPIGLVEIGPKYYIDANLVVLDYVAIDTLPIVTITGLSAEKVPQPGSVWKEDDLAAAIDILRRLDRMDSLVTPDNPLLFEIKNIDVTNFDGRSNRREPHIKLYAKDGTIIVWGAEVDKWAEYSEVPDTEKIGRLYTLYKENGTIQDISQYINLCDPTP